MYKRQDLDSRRERTEEREAVLKGQREGEEGNGCGVLRKEDGLESRPLKSRGEGEEG